MLLLTVSEGIKFYKELSWPWTLLLALIFIVCGILILKVLKVLYFQVLSTLFEWISSEQGTTVQASPDGSCKTIVREVKPFEGFLNLSPTIRTGEPTSAAKAEAASHNLLQWPTYFLMAGMEAILDDEVTPAFNPQTLGSWNLLSRNSSYYYIGVKLMALWMIGFFVRYVILFPCRFLLAATSVMLFVFLTMITILIPVPRLRRGFYRFVVPRWFRLFNKSFSSSLTFHDIENRPRYDGICVANHTSPLDVAVLCADQPYAMVGQRGGGFLGFVEGLFSMCESHIWFERGEMRDRTMVARLIRQHVENPHKLPILVFPEGVCINNASVLMFKKGSFEIGCPVYPVAIKYDCRYSDCFWSSRQDFLLHHMLVIMTSWALKVDVWYLPVQQRLPSEDAVAFANRVKHLIAEKANLVDLNWDGALKAAPPKETMREAQQEQFYKMLKKD